ncbi:MAG: HNH endonuclease signature motif containing protein, partial [Sphaerospermopsis sp.]|nr:HNH endonuclease signature motif containing protein [Sphaerospermopsis sp.]
MPIPKSLYEQVRQRAQCRCEYCHYPELLSTAPLSIDHLQPQSLGGTDSPDNLALACRRCNERRYNFTTGILSTMKIMNAIELFPTLRNLTRADKLKVMQFLVSELAKDEEP